MLRRASLPNRLDHLLLQIGDIYRGITKQWQNEITATTKSLDSEMVSQTRQCSWVIDLFFPHLSHRRVCAGETHPRLTPRPCKYITMSPVITHLATILKSDRRTCAGENNRQLTSRARSHNITNPAHTIRDSSAKGLVSADTRVTRWSAIAKMISDSQGDWR